MLARIASFIGYVSDRRRRTYLFSAAVFTFFGLVASGVDLITLQRGFDPDIHTIVESFCIAATAGLVSLLLLSARAEQRRLAREELARVAELNHRLRNALQVIKYANHLDPEHQEMMIEAVDSMETALRQLFPAVASARRSDAFADIREHHARS